MGRPEQPLPSPTGPLCEFASALRELRARAGGPSYRRMAVVTHFSAATLARAAAGHVLPSLEVAVAYACACGGDRQEWERRWHECEQDITRLPRPPESLDTTGDAGRERPDEPDELAAARQSTGHGRAVRALRVLRSWWAVAALAGVSLIGGGWIAAGIDSRGTPTSAATNTRIAPVSGGHGVLAGVCAPGQPIAPTPAVSRPAATARIRTSFEPGQPVWGPYWQHGNLAEEITPEQHYDGADSLRISVLSDRAAVGTVHLDQLLAGDTITVHIYYGGHGSGEICPFVQTKDFKIAWVAQKDLELTPADKPGWRAYSWVMPAVNALGIGIQLNNTGISEFTVLIDAVSW